MNTTTKKAGWAAGLLAAALAMTPAGAWAADADNSNNSDQIVIRITPNADYGVEIDTTNVTLDLGTLSLGTTAFLVKPATVTIVGTVSRRGVSNTGQELDVTAGLTGGWLLDAAPTTGSQAGNLDELAMYLLFSATSLSEAPSGVDFASGNADITVTQSAIRAGGTAGVGTRFEKATGFGTTDMDNLSVSNKKHMWAWFRLPSETSVGGAQDVTVTLTATGTSL